MKTITRCLGSTELKRDFAHVGLAERREAAEAESWADGSVASRCGFV